MKKKTIINMSTTKEILSRGTKAENPVRDLHPFVKPQHHGTIVATEDNDIKWYRNELQSSQDEVATLEREIKDLNMELYNKEEEIDELKDELDELKIRLETFESLEP